VYRLLKSVYGTIILPASAQDSARSVSEVFIGDFKDLGPLHKFLGIIIDTRPEGGFRLHQAPNILELLDRLGLDNVAFADSPAKRYRWLGHRRRYRYAARGLV
jgi:hypothetical protein